MNKLLQNTAILFALLVVNNSYAQDFFDLLEVEETEPEKEERPWAVRGHVQQEFKYGIDTPDTSLPFERDEAGLSQVRTEFFAELKYQFNDSLSSLVSAKTELDWLRWQAGDAEYKFKHYDTVLKDAYLDYTLENGLWLRAGNQVIAWGESESLGITDVLSTKDLREPGQAELEDIREPIPALLISTPLQTESGSAKLNLVLSYQAGFDRYAKPFEEFYPGLFLGKTSSDILEYHQPQKEWEAALQYLAQLNGGDVSVVFAEVNDNTPDLLSLSLNAQNQQIDEAIFFQRRHFFYGMSVNRVISSWILRSEFGVYDEQNSLTNLISYPDLEQEKRFMFGVEYSGWNDWLISAEYNFLNKKIKSTNQKEDDAGFAIQLQRSALNEKLDIQLWHMKLADEGGKITRLNVSFTPVDNWELSAAYIAYENDNIDSTLYPFRKNDSVNMVLKYGF